MVQEAKHSYGMIMASLENQLLQAAEKGNLEKLTALLSDENLSDPHFGLYVDYLSNRYSGRTALMKAALNHHKDCVSLLIEKGADINYFSNDGSTTALTLVTRFLNDDYVLPKHVDMVAFLLQKGANVNLQNRYGFSPIMYFVCGSVPYNYAGQKEVLDILKLYIDYGADISLRNKDGQSLIDLANAKAQSVKQENFIAGFIQHYSEHKTLMTGMTNCDTMANNKPDTLFF